MMRARHQIAMITAVVKVSQGPPGRRARPRLLELSAILAPAPGWWAPAAAANAVAYFRPV